MRLELAEAIVDMTDEEVKKLYTALDMVFSKERLEELMGYKDYDERMKHRELLLKELEKSIKREKKENRMENDTTINQASFKV